jgi:hypothetical protein
VRNQHRHNSATVQKLNSHELAYFFLMLDSPLQQAYRPGEARTIITGFGVGFKGQEWAAAPR